jgi:cytidine deaminase
MNTIPIPNPTPCDPASAPSPTAQAADTGLWAQACAARQHAHAPYSRFQVGAALRTHDGQVFAGCNVENAAYGLCHCAERVAFGSAIAAGVRPGAFEALAVVGDTPGPISPCGACRQVMFELGGPGLRVLLGNLQGLQRATTVGALLPEAFGPEALSNGLPAPRPGDQ